MRLCATLGLDGLDLYLLNLIPGTLLLTAYNLTGKPVGGT